MTDRLPCINCLTLAICRAQYLSNIDNTISRSMKARFAINKCTLAKEYLYVHPTKFSVMKRANSSEETIINTYDAKRVNQILTYFEQFK